MAGSEAIAGTLDSNFKPDIPKDPEERETYENSKTAIENLSQEDRYRLALMLAESYHNDFGATGSPTKGHLEKHMDGATFRSGAMRIFEMSEYRWR